MDNLNKEQKMAALHKEGPLLVLAGAGSGKTKMMTHRIAHLIEEGVSPYDILAVTFTNKAAGEMKERVEALVGEIRGMWIQTFHSACLRILRIHGDKIGYSRDFVVYDPADQRTIIRNAIKELKVDEKQFKPAYFLSVISDSKNKGISPDEYEKQNIASPRTKDTVGVYRFYEKVLKTNMAMDFDDLLIKTVELFDKNPDVLKEYQDKFKYIMVDEYQDTNRIQYRFIKLLAQAHNNICVVGDDDQCIYQWRGADINNILDFEKDFKGTKVVKLEKNYRSSGNILAGANSVIINNKDRKGKKLWTDKSSGEKISYFRAENDKIEAGHVASQIDRLKTSDRQYSDFAILYRTNVQSRLFEEALRYRGIPYRILSGLRYYDRKEVKDMVAYMRLVLNPFDDLSLERIINEPKRGVGAKTLEKLKALASVNQQSLLEVIGDPEIADGLTGKTGENVRDLAQVLEGLTLEKDSLRISDIYDALLVKTGYLKALEDQRTVEAESRIENLLEFKSVIFDYESQKEKDGEEGSLQDFMESIALMAEIDNMDTEENAVVLMTVHSAKGLEFPIVFMVGMEDGLFPTWRSFEDREGRGIEEERRLCYVGMTRAMERLFMTGAEQRTIYGKTDYTKESMFLREIDRKFLEGHWVDTRERKNFFDDFGSSYSDNYPREDEIFKPFASLKQTKEVADGFGVLEDVKAGTRVEHRKFGQGTVMEVDKTIVRVAFDEGDEKRLALGMAPLKILD